MADITDNASFLTELKVAMASLATEIGDDILNRAIESANAELGWSYPLSGKKKYWSVERAKRHSLADYILTPAQDFKAKQYSLEQPFEHFRLIIKDMDAQFEFAQSSDSALFANVDPSLAFGYVSGTGSVYSITGRDIGTISPSHDWWPHED
jgi:hypothetical protein